METPPPFIGQGGPFIFESLGISPEEEHDGAFLLTTIVPEIQVNSTKNFSSFSTENLLKITKYLSTLNPSSTSISLTTSTTSIKNEELEIFSTTEINNNVTVKAKKIFNETNRIPEKEKIFKESEREQEKTMSDISHFNLNTLTWLIIFAVLLGNLI